MMGIKKVTVYDENYPKLLKQIYDPPKVLYYIGNLECLNQKTIAVVGTRKMTGNGKANCESFVKNFVGHNLTIVSGLALGIDTIAHKTAVENGGKTVAVLGGGLDNIYPMGNKQLAKSIIDSDGVVLSEFPPDYPVFQKNFPIRNRIISGLSQVTLVVEAGSNSGSQITARLALEQGRDVFVIDQEDLQRDGAKQVFDPGEILEELGIRSAVAREALNKEEQKIIEILGNEQLHIDEICRTLDFSIASVSALLLKMEIAGLIKNLGGGIYAGA